MMQDRIRQVVDDLSSPELDTRIADAEEVIAALGKAGEDVTPLRRQLAQLKRQRVQMVSAFKPLADRKAKG